MGYIFTLLSGILLTIAFFANWKFTPQVHSTDVERAISVCKEGKWVTINNSEIICEDRVVYPRTSKS